MADMGIQFGTGSQFGTLTGWAAQSPTITVAEQRANALGEAGDEVAFKLYDKRTDVSQEFVASNAATAPTVPANIGDLLGGNIVTGISISTSATDFVKMTLTGHNHDANAHAALRKVEHGISLSKAFGAIDFLGGTAGSAATVESSTCDISCQHEDIQTEDGAHAAGQNYDARIQVTVTWNGVPTTVAASGWSVTSVETKPNPQGFLQTTVTAEKALTLPAPSGNAT
jgi:hypothetical protein